MTMTPYTHEKATRIAYAMSQTWPARTRDDIASRTGLSAATTGRTLAKMREHGLVVYCDHGGSPLSGWFLVYGYRDTVCALAAAVGIEVVEEVA